MVKLVGFLICSQTQPTSRFTLWITFLSTSFGTKINVTTFFCLFYSWVCSFSHCLISLFASFDVYLTLFNAIPSWKQSVIDIVCSLLDQVQRLYFMWYIIVCKSDICVLFHCFFCFLFFVFIIWGVHENWVGTLCFTQRL